jgi:hypothetical protein
MNAERLHRQLVEIAEQAIPETVDVWPAVEQRILKDRRAGKRRRSAAPRIAWVTAMLAVITVLGLATYAGAGWLYDRVAGWAEVNDEGVAAVYKTGLFHDVDITQSLEGVTITVEWVYADPIRVLVGWRSESNDPQLSSGLLNLTDSRGDRHVAFYTIGDLSENQIVIETFLAPDEASRAEAIDVTATFEVQRTRITGRHPGNGWSQDDDDNWFYRPELIGTVPVRLTIPVTDGKVVEVGQTVVAAGIPMTLERLYFAPSSTRADVCFEAPDASSYRWAMKAELRVGKVLHEANFFYSYPTAQVEGMRLCVPIVVGDVAPSDVERVSLQIVELYAQMEGAVERREIEGPWDFVVQVAQ